MLHAYHRHPAYTAGATAQANGVGIDANPYHHRHEAACFRAWQWGWRDAHDATQPDTRDERLPF